MRLHILSDLHLEFGLVDIPHIDTDVVVLAGDISVGSRGLDWIRSHFPEKPVIYVLGNHEYYHNSLPELTEMLHRKTVGTHIHVLENEAVELGGYSFLGCTLWTDFSVGSDPEKAMANAERYMNDYRLIRFGKGLLRAQDTVRLHHESVAWLQAEFKRHDPAKTIVVTHNAPSPRSEDPHYANGPLSPAFVANLDPLIAQSGVPLWIYGHTHFNTDYRTGNTRVLTNQQGYPNEGCKGFDPGMTVEI